MRLLVDGSAASGVGAHWTRLRELARELPARAPQYEVAFVVRPRLRAQIEEIVAGSAEVISPSPVRHRARVLAFRASWGS